MALLQHCRTSLCTRNFSTLKKKNTNLRLPPPLSFGFSFLILWWFLYMGPVTSIQLRVWDGLSAQCSLSGDLFLLKTLALNTDHTTLPSFISVCTHDNCRSLLVTPLLICVLPNVSRKTILPFLIDGCMVSLDTSCLEDCGFIYVVVLLSFSLVSSEKDESYLFCIRLAQQKHSLL